MTSGPSGATRALLAEFDHEMASTRRLLERVPDGRYDWSPHDKSMKLGRLASHIADVPSWLPAVAGRTELDFKLHTQTRAASTAELVAAFERNLTAGREALAAVADDAWSETFTLRAGDHVVFALPRKVAIRSFVLNHLIHHRGQLSVYLRLLDVPVPGMYGPSADEK
jgi:uncharacterized damage-inducible protein DinB